jgi:hypothetical protein
LVTNLLTPEGVWGMGVTEMYMACRHIEPNGPRCKSPALRGGSFCYFHARSRRREQRIEQFRKFHEGIQEIQKPERP